MSGNCVEKLSHKTATCDSSDGLQVFEQDGKYTGFCFSCGTYVPDPYKEGSPPKKKKVVKSDEEYQKEVDEVSSLSSRDLPTRKLSASTLEYFGVKVALSEMDGQTPVAYFYPGETQGKLVNYKGKIIETKQYFRAGPKGDTDPFGWSRALASGSPKIFITEGEDDAMALWQALKQHSANTKWADLNPAVISLTNGAGGVDKELGRIFHDLIKFRDIILCFDMDEAGEVAKKKALQLFPTANVAKLPCKDANDCVIEGRSEALCKAVLFQASTPKNTRLVNAKSLFLAAREKPKWGLSWPIEQLTEVTRGIRFGETYYFGSGVKMGKTEWRNTIADHLMHYHNLPIFMAALEEVNNKTVKLVLGKRAKAFFHDPKREFSEVKYDQAAAEVNDKLWLLDLYQHADWKTLRSDIVMAAHMGCKAAFIDPITNIINGLSAAETDTVLKEIAPDMSALGRELDMAIFIFCHLKSPESGPPHEMGGRVYSSQFAGSRAMMRSCNYMFGIEGNKDSALPVEQRNMRHLILLEDREYGEVADIPLYWDENTGCFNEV